MADWENYKLKNKGRAHNDFNMEADRKAREEAFKHHEEAWHNQKSPEEIELEKWQNWQAELAKKVDAQKALEDEKDLIRNDQIDPNGLRPTQDFIEECVGSERRSDHEIMQQAQKELATEIRHEREIKAGIEAHNADIERQKRIEAKSEELRIKFERDRTNEREF